MSIKHLLETHFHLHSANNNESMLPVSRQFSRVRCFAAACVRPPVDRSSAPGRRFALPAGSNQLRRLRRSDIFLTAHDRKAHFLVLRRVFMNAPSTDARPNMAKGSSRDTSLTSHTVGKSRTCDSTSDTMTRKDNCGRVGKGGSGRH